jgi:signal transduction histidine kinase
LAGYEQAMRWLYLWAGGAVILSFLILLQAFRRTQDAVLRAQLKWVLWGHIFGMSPYILFYALPIGFSGTPLISYGVGLAPFPIIVFAYLFSFYRYRLMDVDEVIHSSVVYGVSAGLLTLLYLVGIGLFHRIIQISTGGRSAGNSDLFFLLALAFVFNPMKNLVQKGIDRALFPERNELPGILLEGSSTIARASNMSGILDYLLLKLPDRFGIEFAAVALMPQNGEKWEVRMRPEGWAGWCPDMKAALQLLAERIMSSEELEIFSLEGEYPRPSPMAHLKEKDVYNVFPLKSGKDLWGFYLLGKRSANRLLNSEEARLIATISTQAAHRVGNARLLETVQKANKSLVELSSRLMQTEQMANLGEGAAMLAHELKTPLGIIRGSAEILDRARDPEKDREVVGFIIEESDRLAGIVDDFIQFARIPLPSKAETDLNDLVQSAALLWESRKKSRGDILLRFRLSPAVGNVDLDSKQIYQVLLNLFSNAEEAMPGGGELLVSTEVDAESEQVRISVQDSGKGIPAQDLGRVFDRFFTTKESGLGIGLAVVKKIMEAHGGAVQIGSSSGKGTEVMLTLPKGFTSSSETQESRR